MMHNWSYVPWNAYLIYQFGGQEKVQHWNLTMVLLLIMYLIVIQIWI
jgi:hypothetical protein